MIVEDDNLLDTIGEAMEYAIGPKTFNYKEILANLKDLSTSARHAAVPVFYSVQTPFDVAKEEAGVWVRIRMKRAKASDPNRLLQAKDDPKDREPRPAKLRRFWRR